jgi:hypothetical protein
MNRRVLVDLLPIRHPGDLLDEALGCCGLKEGTPGGTIAGRAFQMICRLYRGEWNGYGPCDTPYHDFAHVAEVFLAMARLIHGAVLSSEPLSEREQAIGLVAAIVHDAGYIGGENDAHTRGAQFRSGHEIRSMAFLERHGASLGLTNQEVDDGCLIIRGTMMAEDVNTFAFRSGSQELLVRMLSVADLLAQLSSATYLERLMFLWEEDRDSLAPHYENLTDCYRKAILFDETAQARIQAALPGSNVYLSNHFGDRWNTSTNLYTVAMERQIAFLAGRMTENAFDPRHQLRRWNSVKVLQQRMAEDERLEV